MSCFSADLVSGVETQVLMTLLTVVICVIGCIFGQLNPRCSPSEVHLLLTHRVSWDRQQGQRQIRKNIQHWSTPGDCLDLLC